MKAHAVARILSGDLKNDCLAQYAEVYCAALRVSRGGQFTIGLKVARFEAPLSLPIDPPSNRDKVGSVVAARRELFG